MLKLERVTRMRRLLEDARRVEVGGRIRHLGGELPLDSVQRRALVKHVQLAGTRYGLQEDIDVYLAAAGCATPAGLDIAQLHALASWVGQAMDRLATAADCPDTPPAC